VINGGLDFLELGDAAFDHLVLGLIFGDRERGLEDADGAGVLALLAEDVCGVDAIAEVFGLERDGLDVEHVGFVELLLMHSEEGGEGVVGGGEGGI
jgi:hypothetical protein